MIKAIVRDENIEPGQYHYMRTHSWTLAVVGTPKQPAEFRRETVTTEWIPANLSAEWLTVHEITGRRDWIRGSHETAVKAGFITAEDDQLQRSVSRRAGGRLAAAKVMLADRGESASWQLPTMEFFASLPREPELLLARLRTDSPTRPASSGYSGEMTYALDSLRTGLVPADLRIALYEALLLLPEARLEQHAISPDGSTGYALILNRGPKLTEIFADSETDHFIGERSTRLTIGPNGLPPGTVTRSTAITHSISDGIGIPPPGR